jgi:hypothetical protein
MASSTILSRSLAGTEPYLISANSIRNQVDGLVSNFIQEATNPSVMVAMTSAGMAYRVGRVGVMGLGTSLVLRPLSLGVGFASEVTVFEFTNRFLTNIRMTRRSPLQDTSGLWSWSGPGGWKEGLFNSAITFGLLKSAGRLARDQNLILQHSFQSAAMVAGHQGAAFFNLASKPEGSLAEQLLQAETTNLQLTFGGHLTQGLFPGISALERGMDLSLRLGSHENFLSTETNSLQKLLGLSMASVSGSELDREKETALKTSLLAMSSPSEAPGGTFPLLRRYRPTPPLIPSQREKLNERWGPTFADGDETKLYSRQTFEKILKIRSSLPGLHDQILEAFSRSPYLGKGEQFELAERLQWLFNFNALASSTGNFENAILQFLIERAVSDPRPEKGKQALGLTLRKMEGSPSASEFIDLIRRFGYDWDQKISDKKIAATYPYNARYQEAAAGPWKEFQDPHKILLFNYVARRSGEDGRLTEKMIELFEKAKSHPDYAEEFDLALDYARKSPLTELVLDRLLHLFIVQDHCSKLTELTEDFWSADPLMDIPQWIKKGASPEEVANKINGTRYTAYVNDLALAAKIVSVTLEAHEHFKNPRKTEDSQKLFHQALIAELKKSQPLTVDQMMSLFILQPTPLALRIYNAWGKGRLEVKFVPQAQMRREAKALEDVAGLQNLFKRSETGEVNTIFLPEIPSFDLSRPEGEAEAFFRWGANFGGLAHEGEHDEHALLRSVHRHDRIVSEMLSGLEEFNWDVRNYTNHFQKMGRGLGNRLPLFLRSLAEHNYFRRTNESLVRQFMSSNP